MNQTSQKSESEHSNLLKMSNDQSPNVTVATSEEVDVVDAAEIPTFWSEGKEMLVAGPLNILLLCIPFAFAAKYWNWSDSFIFIFSLLSLAPLAERLGFITEQLAMHTNDTIGGLLNATFGNAPELIVAIAALNHGLYRLVQLSLLGSILSNLLLVLGTSFICGGLRFKTQYFNKISSQVNATLLMLCGAGVLFPTILSLSGQETPLGEVGFSRATCVVLVVVYIAFLYFQVSLCVHLTTSCCCCLLLSLCFLLFSVILYKNHCSLSCIFQPQVTHLSFSLFASADHTQRRV